MEIHLSCQMDQKLLQATLMACGQSSQQRRPHTNITGNALSPILEHNIHLP